MLDVRFHAPPLAVLMLAALSGCGGYRGEVWDLTIERDGGVPVFRWEGGEANQVVVDHCSDGCELRDCVDGLNLVPVGDAPSKSWNTTSDWEIEADLASDATFASPLRFGVLPSGKTDPAAGELTKGRQYGVLITLMRESEDGKQIETRGAACGTFVF